MLGQALGKGETRGATTQGLGSQFAYSQQQRQPDHCDPSHGRRFIQGSTLVRSAVRSRLFGKQSQDGELVRAPVAQLVRAGDS